MNTTRRQLEAPAEDIDELLANFCKEYRKKLDRAYQLVGDDPSDWPSGMMILPKLVLRQVADAYAFPPSMNRELRELNLLLDTQL